MKNKIIHDTKWNIIDFMTSFLITFVNIKLLTNVLGLEGYGFYSLFIGLISTFGLVDIGMGMAISKYLSEHINNEEYKEANQIIEIGLLFYLIIGIISTVLIFIFKQNIIIFLNLKDIYYSYGMQVIMLLPIIMTINFIVQILNNILVAFEKWKIISIVNILFKTVNFLGILLIAFYLNEKMLKIFYIFLILAIVKLFVLGIIIFYNYKFFKLIKVQKKMLIKITDFLKYSLLQYIFSILLGHLDNLIIAKFINLSTVGFYQIAMKVMNYLYSFLVNIFKVIFPKISQLHGKLKKEEINRMLKKNLLICEGISIVIALIVGVLWKFLIGKYLGNKIANETYFYIIAFLIYLVIRAPEIIYYYYYNAIAKPKVFVQTTMYSGILNFILYIIFIPIYGAFGVIIGHIISKFFTIIYFKIYYEKIQRSEVVL